MTLIYRAMAAVISAMIVTNSATAGLIRVGPTRDIKLPSVAATVADDGDVVEIDAADYHGDVAVWRQNGLTLRAVGGRAHLRAEGRAAEGKAIWVIKGDDTTVEHFEFSGTRVNDRNGAGIRQEGRNLIVRHCYFHDNENGILGGAGDLLVEYSEFANNGYGDGQSHNLYISNRTDLFTLQYSYSHHAKIGHQVKSRAAETRILYNRLGDERDGRSSYIVDLPNGGLAYVIGNILHQGSLTENFTLLAYGAEGVTRTKNALFVVNNSLVNDYHGGIFIHNHDRDVKANVVNNLFVGSGETVKGQAVKRGNLVTQTPRFVNREALDLRLTSRSPAIDRGIEFGDGDGVEIVPRFEYRHPAQKVERKTRGPIDVGAFEFVPER